jgi:hypothetical protein
MIRPRNPLGVPCDDEDEMRTHRLDDATAEAVLRGVVPAERPDLHSLVAVTEHLRGLHARTAPPAPAGQLARLLDSGLAPIDDKGDQLVTAGSKARPAPQVSGLPKRRKNVVTELLAGIAAKLGAAGALTKGAAGVSIALASVTGAAAADVLPDAVQDRVAGAVEQVSPFDMPDSADARPDVAPDGAEVSRDAQDGGVDGRQLSEDARSQHGPETLPKGGAPEDAPAARPEQPGQTGLDTANTTPASPNAPDTAPVPAERPAPAQPEQVPAEPPVAPAPQAEQRGGNADTAPAPAEQGTQDTDRDSAQEEAPATERASEGQATGDQAASDGQDRRP